MSTETRTLSLHPMAIYTFIRAQSGSLAKALAESAMNSIDASATQVDIELTSYGFVVKDDGQGFQSKDEIAAWFETLGFPHDEGNHRVWGVFGMGRAQAWSYARTVWTSNQFRMDVDVKKRGLDYELRLLPVARPGTRIDGTFYQPMSDADILRAEQELEKLLQYMPGIVTLNGRRINKDPLQEEWTLETEDAYIRILDKKTGGIQLYNVGVFVQQMGYYQYKVSALVVSKIGRAFKLNVARNEVLQAECEVWRRVRKVLEDYADKKASPPAKKKLSVKEERDLVDRFKAGDLGLAQLLEAFPMALHSVYQRPVALNSLGSIWCLPEVAVSTKDDAVAKRIHARKAAVVLEKSCLARLGLQNVQQLKDRVYEELTKAFDPKGKYADSLKAWKESLWYDRCEDLFPLEYAGQEIILTKDMTPRERAVHVTWQRTWSVMSRYFEEALYKAGLPKNLGGSRPSLGEGAKEVWYVPDQGFVFRRDVASSMLSRSAGRVTQDFLALLKNMCLAYVQAMPQEQELSAETVKELATRLYVTATTETELVGIMVPSLLRRYAYSCKDHGVPLTETTTNAVGAYTSPEV